MRLGKGKDVGAEDGCHRPARPNTRHGGGGVGEHLGAGGDDAAEQVEEEIAHPPEQHLDVVAKHPQEEHVAAHVEPAAVHEHGGHQRIEITAVEDLYGHRPPRHDERLQGLRAERDLVDKDEGVDGHQRHRHDGKWRATQALVTDGKHGPPPSPPAQGPHAALSACRWCAPAARATPSTRPARRCPPEMGVALAPNHQHRVAEQGAAPLCP